MQTKQQLQAVRQEPGRPLYESVMDAIIAAIDAGAFPPGAQIPNTKTLSEQLGVSLVTAHRATERVTIASFKTAIAVAVRRRGYQGETALSQGEVASLLALPALLWRQLPFTGNAAQVPAEQGPVKFDRPTFIAKCHSLGLRVDFWTIDDPAEAARLLELGADGIMTNDPAAMRSLFAPSTAVESSTPCI